MEVLRRPLFLICLVLFTLHQVMQWGFQLPVPIADAFLDNVLAMPIILTLWLAEKRIVFNKGKGYELSAAEITVATIYILVITEWLFPLLSSRFTADGWDLLFTSLGSLMFYFSAKPYSAYLKSGKQ